MFRKVIGAAILLIIIAVYFFYQKTRDRIFIDNSLIGAPITNVAPVSAGKLMEMDVYEGEKVKKGDALAIVGTDTLWADTDGLVVMANRQIGAAVSMQNPVVSMIDPSNLRVNGTIDENKGLNKILVGQAVSFTVDAFPGKTFWGWVDEVSETAKATQLSFSISGERPTQQFIVYAKFDFSKYPEIKNGMSAKMTVYTRQP